MLIKLVFLLVGLRTLNERENNDESRFGQNWKVGANLKVHRAYCFCLCLKQLWCSAPGILAEYLLLITYHT